MLININGNLVDHITRWRTDRRDIVESKDTERKLYGEQYTASVEKLTEKNEDNRDTAVDLLVAIAALVAEAKAMAELQSGEPWCNHDAPAVIDGVCECGVRVPKPKKRRNRSA